MSLSAFNVAQSDHLLDVSCEEKIERPAKYIAALSPAKPRRQ